jgi:DNA-binding SARP family transcriptional activator
MTAATLEIRLLGDFVLRQDGRTVNGLDASRLQALLAYLLLHRDAPQLRHYLAFVFWPDSDESQARTNLRNLLHRLRQAWPEADAFLTIETKSISWRPNARLRLDTAEFLRAVDAAQAATSPVEALPLWQDAIDLYRGDLLPGCYDDWIEPERTRLHQLFLQALAAAVQLAVEAQDDALAIQLNRQLIEADPLRETAYRQLMNLYARQGDRAAALRVYHRCVALLRQELAVDPSPATQEVHQRLLVPSGAGPARSLPAAPIATALIGRHFEWEQLHAFWQQTAAGEQPASLALISGEAGIGKSKLAEEFVTSVRRQNGTTAVAACYAPETTISFAPVASWLRNLPLEKLAPVWRTELARLLPELAPPDQPLTPPPPLTEAWQKQRFYEALTQAILSQKQPICLQLEDIQWSDPETLAWLHYLLRRDDRARLFILTTHRQEEGDNELLRSLLLQWRQQGRLLNIDLARLDAADAAALATTILGQPLPPELAAALYRYTEGNPLFIVETVRSSLEQDWDSGDQADRTQLLAQRLPADDTAAAPLPPKILAVIRARLGQLSATAQRALEAATVIGRSFTIDMLLQVSGFQEDELVTAVDELWQRRIVRDREGNAYDFSHDKLRQVAYQAITPARRRWLHGRLAHTLTAMDAAQPEPLAGRIAFHYEAAGQIEKALHYHQKAATEARLVYAAQEEAYHLQRAIALQGPADAARLIPLYEQLGHAYATLGRQDEGRQAYQAALALAPASPTARAVLTLRLANTWLSQYELDKAWQIFDEAVTLLGDAAGFAEPEWTIWLEARLAQFDVAYYAANLVQMEGVMAELEPLVEKHGSPVQRILFYQKQAQLHSRQTRFRHTEQGVAYTRAALRLAEEMGDEQWLHASRFGLGFMLLWQAPPEPAAAAAMFEKAAAGSQATGNVPLLDRCLAYLTTAHRLQGDESRLRALLPQSRAVAESEENGLYIAVAQAHQAWLAVRNRRWSEAAAAAQTALVHWQKLVFPFHWLACWPYLAAAVHQGDLATAAAQAQAMLAPEQQLLPAALAAALTTAAADPTPAHFQHALALAREHQML